MAEQRRKTTKVRAAGESLEGKVRLKVIPLTLKEANDLVTLFHRHHKPAVGHRFSLGAQLGDSLVGACIIGRPVARMIDWHTVCEVTRLVPDGTKNAYSILYAASARAAQAMGFEKIQTYILESEPGTSLKAAGWMCEGEAGGGDWNVTSRGGRRTDQPMERKQRWARYLQ